MKVRALPTAHEPLPDGRTNPDITVGREYLVVGIDDSTYRLVNDHYEPILYERSLFEVTDAVIPVTWIREDFADGEYHIDPPECSQPGFYERWHDRDREARRIFANVFKRLVESDGR